MNDFFDNLQRKRRFQKRDVSLHSVMVFESYEQIYLRNEDCCEALIGPLLEAVKNEPEFIRPKDIPKLETFLSEFLEFKYETPGRQAKKVKYLPLTYLEPACREWILDYNRRQDERPLASTYALLAAELISFSLGKQQYGEKAFRLGLFDTKDLHQFWSRSDCAGLSFLNDKNFKRVFSKGMKKPILQGLVPKGGKIKINGNKTLSYKKKFYFIPERCHLSDGFDENFLERYVYGYFHCSIPDPLKYEFTSEPYLKGALTHDIESVDLSNNNRESVCYGEMPLRWIVASLEKDPSSPSGFQSTPV